MNRSIITKFAIILSGLFVSLPAEAQVTNTFPQQFQINAAVNYGLSQYANTSLLNYNEPNASTALFQQSTVVSFPANSTDNAVDLSALFPIINTALVWGWTDISFPGQQINWGLASGGTRLNQAPGGFTLMRANGSKPILYFDNPSPNTTAVLQIFTIAN